MPASAVHFSQVLARLLPILVSVCKGLVCHGKTGADSMIRAEKLRIVVNLIREKNQ